MKYLYKYALIWQNEDGYWMADCYPDRCDYDPDTVLGEFLTRQEAEEAVDKAP